MTMILLVVATLISVALATPSPTSAPAASTTVSAFASRAGYVTNVAPAPGDLCGQDKSLCLDEPGVYGVYNSDLATFQEGKHRPCSQVITDEQGMNWNQDSDCFCEWCSYELPISQTSTVTELFSKAQGACDGETLWSFKPHLNYRTQYPQVPKWRLAELEFGRFTFRNLSATAVVDSVVVRATRQCGNWPGWFSFNKTFIVASPNDCYDGHASIVIDGTEFALAADEPFWPGTLSAQTMRVPTSAQTAFVAALKRTKAADFSTNLAVRFRPERTATIEGSQWVLSAMPHAHYTAIDCVEVELTVSEPPRTSAPPGVGGKTNGTSTNTQGSADGGDGDGLSTTTVLAIVGGAFLALLCLLVLLLVARSRRRPAEPSHRRRSRANSGGRGSLGSSRQRWEAAHGGAQLAPWSAMGGGGGGGAGGGGGPGWSTYAPASAAAGGGGAVYAPAGAAGFGGAANVYAPASTATATEYGLGGGTYSGMSVSHAAYAAAPYAGHSNPYAGY